MSTELERLSYIDALRGYAILGVIAVHTSQLFPGLEAPFRLVAEQGARGVQLFFVASALTLTLSWHARHDGTLPFYVRRVFRIAPMFWVAIVYYAVFNPVSYWGPGGASWSQIVASATFMHGFHPDTMSSIVPGGWTIADEMTFYLLFPLLMWGLRSWQAVALALIGLSCLVWGFSPFMLAVWAAVFPTTDHAVLSDFSGHVFPYQLPVFLVGILVFYLLRAFSRRLPPNILRIGLAGALVLIAALPFIAAWLPGHVHWMVNFMLLGYPVLIYSLAFGLLAFCLAQGVGRPLVNTPVRYIGKVSYSAYFWHFAVLSMIGRALDAWEIMRATPTWPYYLATFVTTVLLTTIGSTLTFYMVEAPMINVGRRLAFRMRKPQIPACLRLPALAPGREGTVDKELVRLRLP